MTCHLQSLIPVLGLCIPFCDIDFFFKHPYFDYKMGYCHYRLDRRCFGGTGREKRWHVTQWALCDPWVQLRVCGACSDAHVLPLSPGSRPSPLSL